MSHENFMHQALELAGSGLGQTWPNPSVGCVIVKNGMIIASARTADGGRPHAETIALSQADAKGATVYVTLEPCAHHGATPPCSEALIKAGVAEVVIGCIDPDPRVSGKGIKILEAAGIKALTGILEEQCLELNKGFFKLVAAGRPYIMLKAAISKDGEFLAGNNNSPRWVTGEKSRQEVHKLRATYDAIMTGTATILADNPRLDVRIAGLESRSPIKVVVGKTATPRDANILNGKEVWFYEDAVTAIDDLGKKGITRLMIEAGPTLANILLKQKLVDEIIIFQSAENLGDKGSDFFADTAFKAFRKISEDNIGDDLKISWRQLNPI